jgi:ubiquinone/menaquinone biosynthesis C-methylase UbiE
VTEKSEARYDDVSAFYAATHPDVYDEEPDASLLRLCGAAHGLDALDLACGHGRLARELARLGSRVVGIDLSDRLLELARRAERQDHLGVQYVLGDAASPRVLEGRSFDLVVSSFGLSDIDDLEGAVATVARLLRPDGCFVFSILHPCFPGSPPAVSAAWPPGAGYFREGWWTSEASLSTLRQKVGANHRTMSTYVNSLTRHGLTIEEFAEPEEGDGWAGSAQLREPVPVYLAIRCRASRPPAGPWKGHTERT